MRHAIAFVLTQMLGLTSPPVDPVAGLPPGRDVVQMLIAQIHGKLR
jgi:hypothetical protein